MTTKAHVVSTVDATGLNCPLPIVRLKLAMDNVRASGVVELIADDSGIVDDLSAWCRETRNRLISIAKGDDGVFTALVEKGEASYGTAAPI